MTSCVVINLTMLKTFTEYQVAGLLNRIYIIFNKVT